MRLFKTSGNCSSIHFLNQLKKLRAIHREPIYGRKPEDTETKGEHTNATLKASAIQWL